MGIAFIYNLCHGLNVVALVCEYAHRALRSIPTLTNYKGAGVSFHSRSNFVVKIYPEGTDCLPRTYRAQAPLSPETIDHCVEELRECYPTTAWVEGVVVIRPTGTDTIDTESAFDSIKASLKRQGAWRRRTPQPQ